MTKTESEQLQSTLGTVKAQLSRIHHNVNNPLAVIAGNVELLEELSKVLGVDDDFSGPLADILTAVDQLAGSTAQLMVTREILAQLSKEV